MADREYAYLKDSNGNRIDINLFQSFDIEHNKKIVVNESLTGDSAVVYDMGRTQEDVPVVGELLGWKPNQYNSKRNTNKNKIIKDKNKLLSLFEKGEVVTFVSSYMQSGYRTNKFIIKNLKFSVGSGETIPFTMILTEDRTSNVKIIVQELINVNDANAIRDKFNEQARLLIETYTNKDGDIDQQALAEQAKGVIDVILKPFDGSLVASMINGVTSAATSVYSTINLYSKIFSNDATKTDYENFVNSIDFSTNASEGITGKALFSFITGDYYEE